MDIGETIERLCIRAWRLRFWK